MLSVAVHQASPASRESFNAGNKTLMSLEKVAGAGTGICRTTSSLVLFKRKNFPSRAAGGEATRPPAGTVWHGHRHGGCLPSEKQQLCRHKCGACQQQAQLPCSVRRTERSTPRGSPRRRRVTAATAHAREKEGERERSACAQTAAVWSTRTQVRLPSKQVTSQ